MIHKKNLLEIRNKAKDFKPPFKVKESNFVARVKSRWRFPQGRHSKVRQYHRGRPALPTPGYGSPKVVKGLSRSGLIKVLVKNAGDFNGLNKETDGVVISSTVGNRKKLELLNLAKQNQLTVLNVKNIDQVLDGITKGLEERRRVKKQKIEAKTKKQKEKEKKAEEKKKKEAEEKKEEGHDHSPSSEEKEDKERKEIEKLITKKQ